MKEIALSHSRLSTFKSCPRKFKLQYIDKAFPDDSDNPNFVRGNRVHKQLEDYLMWINSGGAIAEPSLGREALNVVPIIQKVHANYSTVMPEQQLATTKDWGKTGWFAKNVVYRAILDLIGLFKKSGIIIDYKTGKVRDYDEYGGQLHLNATMLFAIYEELEVIDVAYVFADHKQTISVRFYRKDFQEFRSYFDDQHRIVNTEEKWEPKINQYCKWCPATKEQCPFSKQL